MLWFSRSRFGHSLLPSESQRTSASRKKQKFVAEKRPSKTLGNQRKPRMGAEKGGAGVEGWRGGWGGGGGTKWGAVDVGDRRQLGLGRKDQHRSESKGRWSLGKPREASAAPTATDGPAWLRRFSDKGRCWAAWRRRAPPPPGGSYTEIEARVSNPASKRLTRHARLTGLGYRCPCCRAPAAWPQASSSARRAFSTSQSHGLSNRSPHTHTHRQE